MVLVFLCIFFKQTKKQKKKTHSNHAIDQPSRSNPKIYIFLKKLFLQNLR